MTVTRSANGKRTVYVDGKLIARAMTAKSLTARAAARHCDITFNILYRMTKANDYAADLPLRHLVDLAGLLGLELADILKPGPHPAENPTLVPKQEPEYEEDDHKRLAHLLVREARGVHPSHVANAFAWTPERVRAARLKLDKILRPLGLRARTANEDIIIALVSQERSARNLLDDQASLGVYRLHGKDPDTGLAHLLHDTLNGIHRNDRGNSGLVKLAEAINLGLIAPGGPGEHDYETTGILRFAFPDED